MTAKQLVLFGSAVLVTLSFGCVEQSKSLSQAEKQALQKQVSKTAPTPTHKVDGSFEDKVVLLGYDVKPAVAKPGTKLNVTWYWKSETKLPEGWRLFTHVADAEGVSRLNADGDGLVRRVYQPDKWQAGEYIEDRQVIDVPKDWNSPRLQLFLGLWNGPHRLNVVRGPKDDENRLKAITLPTGVAAKAPAPSRAIRVPRASEPIVIDGKLDEGAWGAAAPTGTLVRPLDGGPAPFKAKAKLLWSPTHLYVAFDVSDSFLKSPFTKKDEHLWEADCVEVMLDPAGDGKNYFELQVAPTNNSFDTRYDSRRNPGPFGHTDWDSKVESAVSLRGASKVNDDKADEGYLVEMAIPWTAFATGSPPAAAPTPGSKWRANLFVMDSVQGGGQRAAAWSPPMVGDFHTLDRFTEIEFSLMGTEATAKQPSKGPVPTLRLPKDIVSKIRRGDIKPPKPNYSPPPAN